MALGNSSWAAGGAVAYGTRSNAIGNGAVNTYKGKEDTAEQSMAIGYQATADTAGTISLGHNEGDVSGYTVTWQQRAYKKYGTWYDSNQKVITDEQVYDMIDKGDIWYDDKIIFPTFTAKTYSSASYNRLVKVADGVDAHDAVVVEQLKTLAAASDASNIGTNLTKVPVTDANGNIQYEESGAMKLRDATDEEKTTNAESWGSAVGTGEVKSGDKRLVTGGAVYSEVHVDSDGNYIRSDNTVAGNLEALDGKVKTNADNIEKNGRDIETLQQTKADISLSNINDAGKTVINNLAKKSIDVRAGSSNVTVATNDVTDGVKTFTVDMAKDISVDTVAAKDVKTDSLTVNKEATIGGVTIKDSKVTGLADTSIEKGSTSAVNAGTVYNETRVANDGHYIKAANTAGANITALDNQVAANAGNIFNLDNRVGELGSRINKVGAGAAALAALHPLDFDPSDKWDFAAGVGNYRNETAAAVGLFYRPNARSMFNLGWTMGDNRNMVNGGFSIKLGKGSVYNDMSKAQMAETIATQSKEISAMKADNAAIKADYNALKADNEAKEKRIDALEKQMQEIMAKLGK